MNLRSTKKNVWLNFIFLYTKMMNYGLCFSFCFHKIAYHTGLKTSYIY